MAQACYFFCFTRVDSPLFAFHHVQGANVPSSNKAYSVSPEFRTELHLINKKAIVRRILFELTRQSAARSPPPRALYLKGLSRDLEPSSSLHPSSQRFQRRNPNQQQPTNSNRNQNLQTFRNGLPTRRDHAIQRERSRAQVPLRVQPHPLLHQPLHLRNERDGLALPLRFLRSRHPVGPEAAAGYGGGSPGEWTRYVLGD